VLVLIVERLDVFAQERDDDVFGVLGDVVDEVGDPVGVDRLDRVQQEEWAGLVDIVGEIARKCEHQAHHLAFRFGEMVNIVLVGGAICSTADHVQLEDRLFDRPTALRDYLLAAFDPDPFEVLVAEDLQNRLHVVVELLDSFALNLVNTHPQVDDFIADLLAAGFEVIAAFKFVINAVDLRGDSLEIVPELAEFELGLVGFAVEVQ